jgi:hypothetical protein
MMCAAVVHGVIGCDCRVVCRDSPAAGCFMLRDFQEE